ncbi:exopolysaccharide biosynthesis polyprenyl glycosylphosphotransferase [Ilyobacter polytropus]|uniref:Exopolysaccharide biosynthesis polyprenyl glycosylphosphotransferase n=1 Tax=Ilyobacter polytropus (strain ATCC 51220 / DSM 2926 / LMG 16218 / CuHBu1) TaxID=572544 RepID=E3HB24_ILYPC|nr:exopolysaccharide biosynthesis polyprenyl glycosylphosphotransferase [Ilyobacter polytropus]ADO82173.1 exopolysaccharide biosynthesis polyprenyl glycosylphosphotransferase [Ilyobacter polytropus DSM 2926]
MRHLKNAGMRSVYISILFLISLILFDHYGLKRNIVFYGGFLLISIFYYLFDLFNFDVQKYRVSSLITSGLINILGIIISYIFTKNLGYIKFFVSFYFIHHIIRYILLLVFTKKIRVAIIGNRDKTGSIIEYLRISDKYKYMGSFNVGTETGEGTTYWDIKNLNKIVKEEKINKIIVADTRHDKEISKQLLKIKLNGVKVVDHLTFNQEVKGKIEIEHVDDNWLLYDYGFHIFHNNIQKRVKRLFDIIFTIIIFIPAFPIMVMSALIIKYESPGPIFFKQKRIGLGNEPFEMLKFRSMKLHDPNEHSKYAGENDDRITKYGKFMRKMRIDELPQLWNVIRGDMSFVGPRAEWDELCYAYMEKIPYYNVRHSVQPGLTGWAQVMYPYGAGIEDAKRKFEYDLYYIKHQSFITDLLIFFKTIKTVVFGRGR